MPDATLTQAQVLGLISAINRDGYAVLPNWASPTELQAMQSLATQAVAAAGNHYVALSGRDAVQDSPLYEWGGSRDFIDLCRRIVAAATGEQSEDTGLTQTFRCLTGDSGRRESMIFHYDSFVLTTILPVIIPEQGERGDLLMIPNRRPLRRSYLRNLVDKLLVDNAWMQRALKRRFERKGSVFTRIPLQPGHLYLFWGYQSLHTNLPVAPDALRATAVFHYHNVHGSSSLANRLRTSLGLLKGHVKAQGRGEDVAPT